MKAVRVIKKHLSSMLMLSSPRAGAPRKSQNMQKCTTAMVSVLLGDFPPRGELQIAWTRGLSGSTQVLRSSIHADHVVVTATYERVPQLSDSRRTRVTH